MNRSITLTEKEISRFWSKVKIGGPDECWEWQGATNKQGYGIINLSAKTLVASRVAWFINNGVIPDGLFSCHTCDNPPCCNPNHLFLGTFQDNAIDMSNKGRSRKGRKSPLRGELIKSAKFKEEDIIQVKSMLRDGKSCVYIANIYKVTPEAISHIKLGKNWSWLK